MKGPARTKKQAAPLDPKFKALKDRLVEAHALHKAADVLEWDQQVNMPEGGVEARMEQTALLKKLAHQRYTAPELGELLSELCADPGLYPYDSDEAGLLRLAKREYEKKCKLPEALVTELARHGSYAQQVWAEARSKNDFAMFRPALEKMVDLKRQAAQALGAFADPYDAWLSEFEPGMTTAEIGALFAELKKGLVPLVQTVAANSRAVDDGPIQGDFDVDRQRAFCREVAEGMGFDFKRGRQDVSTHPFCESFSKNDVRFTTRFCQTHATSALFGTMHEAGHGLYEQNVAQALEGTPLCAGATMAVHESQSRLWENVVGRSRGFWKRYYPRFQEVFPQLGKTSGEAFYRAINRSKPSFIRVEADELTYSLHVLFRFELERELLSGDLRAKDLPEAWNAKAREYLGLTPVDDRRGVLQDVHWSDGLFGYFPTYAVGNMISVQLYDAAVKAKPGIPKDMEKGDFKALRAWLAENIHRHGRKYLAQELVTRATGRAITAAPYLRYLKTKFEELYLAK